MYIKQLCYYCRSENVRLYDKSDSSFVLCDTCGLVMRNPMPGEVELENMYRHFYSKEKITAGHTEMSSNRISLSNHAHYVLKQLNPYQTILDFGAGTGDFVKLLTNDGHQVDGCELSLGARTEAHRKYGYEFFASLKNISNQYDMITAIEVIEHLRQPWQELEILSTLLKPGGKLYITTPNLNGLLGRLKKANWRDAQKPFHLILFNFSSLKKMLEQSGFEDIKFIRFSPLTATSLKTVLMHRTLQLLALYGGLRVLATKK